MKASSTQHDERLGFSRPARRFRAETAVRPETAEMIAFELVVLALRERLGETAETMRARRTNLE